jgi:hypothetical protein
MRASKQAGIRNAVNVIVGMPHENDDDIAELSSFLERHKKWIDHIFVYRYYFIPHSDMGLRAGRYGLRVTSDGQGVDEIGGMNWSQRQAWSLSVYERIKSLTNDLNSQQGSLPAEDDSAQKQAQPGRRDGQHPPLPARRKRQA